MRFLQVQVHGIAVNMQLSRSHWAV